MRRIGGALFFLGLAGCTSAPPAPVSDADERRLFAAAYDDIVAYHIAAPQPDALSLAGLGKLASIDPALAVERSGDQLVLRYRETSERFDLPQSRDTDAWGELTQKILGEARSLSRILAEFPTDQADETVIDGALASLDPFSHYARPDIARNLRATRNGYGGVGVTLAFRNSEARVATVLAGSPAEAGGVRPDDSILAINGNPIAKLEREDVRDLLRGPPDSEVMLDILRAGQPEPLKLLIRRAYIVATTATLKLQDGIAWLSLRSFNQGSAHAMAQLLARAHREAGTALHGIVLDLRDNPGGLLDQSIKIATLFLDGVAISSTVGRVPQSNQKFAAPAGDGAETLPMAVLLNGGSASSAEIVAAALQDSGRAVVIGTASYGKGTVQTVFRTPDNGELTVTWAQLLTPLGYHLHRHGVVPTLCTANLPDDTGSVAKLLRRRSPLVPTELARPRNELDEQGWMELRKTCPPQRIDRGIDAEVARRLLDDPTLYRGALGATSQTLARRADDTPTP